MLIDRLIHKDIGYLFQSLPVVDSLNCIFANFRLEFELVVKIYTTTEASIIISISIRNFTNIKIANSIKETLTSRKMGIMPQERSETIVSSSEFPIT